MAAGDVTTRPRPVDLSAASLRGFGPVGILALLAIFAGNLVATGGLWMLMCAHAAFDLTALALIYWDLETAVAHWFFK